MRWSVAFRDSIVEVYEKTKSFPCIIDADNLQIERPDGLAIPNIKKLEYHPVYSNSVRIYLVGQGRFGHIFLGGPMK